MGMTAQESQSVQWFTGEDVSSAQNAPAQRDAMAFMDNPPVWAKRAFEGERLTATQEDLVAAASFRT